MESNSGRRFNSNPSQRKQLIVRFGETDTANYECTHCDHHLELE
jgi:hypothetical protein